MQAVIFVLIIIVWIAVAMMNQQQQRKREEELRRRRLEGGRPAPPDKGPVYQAPRDQLEEFLPTVKGEVTGVRTPGRPTGPSISVRQPGVRVEPKRVEPDYVRPVVDYKEKPVEEIAKLRPVKETPVAPPPPQSAGPAVPLRAERARAGRIMRPEGAKPAAPVPPPPKHVTVPDVPATPTWRARALRIEPKGIRGAFVMAEILSPPVALRRMGGRRRHIGV